MTAFVVDRGGVVRQGVTLGGINVVIVSTRDLMDACRELTELVVQQNGLAVLTLGAHPPVNGDQPVAAPIVARGILIGYVELAP